MIAALLMLSAAICAAGQSGAAGRPSARERDANSTPTSKQNARESVQNADEKTAKPASPKTTPTQSAKLESEASALQYSFEFTQPEFIVSRIFIEHDGAGRGKVTFERKNSDPIVDPLELSEKATARIKAHWDALHFLDSDKSYQSEKDYPHLGTNRLRMKQGTRERVAEFNWTADKDAFALTAEYKNAANQAIFIFDITLARENQPLEAPKLMQQLDDLLRRNQISDPQQLTPLLRELSTDERIPLMARNHAGRLLKRVEK